MALLEALANRIGSDVLRQFNSPDVRRPILSTDVCMREFDENTLDERNE
ncbi:hypothetical protein [Natrinema sp. DC36]|nr:hypothetical protein [Natrinema sp. DC36]